MNNKSIKDIIKELEKLNLNTDDILKLYIWAFNKRYQVLPNQKKIEDIYNKKL